MTTEVTTPLSHDSTARQPLAARFVEIALIVLVFFVIAGEPVPHINEPHYLCRMKHFWCPPWGAGDLFLESPGAHLTFVWVFGWLTKWLSLTATAWVGRVVAWTLLAWAWQRLSWRLVPLRLASVLSAASWVVLTQRAHLAGEWAVGGVEAKCFAYVFVLLAIGELVDRRWNRLWLLLGAASACHVLVGGWSVVVCGGIWLIDRSAKKREGEAPAEPNASPAPGSAGASPSQDIAPSPSQDIAPSPSPSITSMLPGLIGGGLLALLGVVPALALTWHEPPELVAEASRIYVFERLPHHLALLTLRMDEITQRFVPHALLLFALLCLVRVNRKLSDANNADRRRQHDGLARVTAYACGAALLAAAGLVVEIVCWNDPQRAASLLRYYWFRLTDIAVPMAVAFQSVSLIARGFARRRTWAAWGIAAALLLTGWHMTAVAWGRFTDPLPPADRRMRDVAAWFDVCDWVAVNTPVDAMFLTPRDSHSFKWRTGRPEVATWKDIPQDALSMVEWFGRMLNVSHEEILGVRRPVRSLGHLGTQRVTELAGLYDVDFVVTDHRRPLEFPVVYWNQEYVVYSVGD